MTRLDLSADQEFLAETTGKFLAKEASFAVLRTLRDDAGGFDRSYWSAGAELGWTSLLVSEEDGGGSVSGNGLVDLTLLAHEFGRRGSPGPLMSSNVVAFALSEHGSDVLDEVLSGRAIATWAHEEASAFGAVSVDIHADVEQVVISGRKRPVEAAGQADWILVTGRTGDGLTQVLVPADAEGLSITPLTSIDLTRRFGSVEFHDVRVPAANVVGPVGGAGPSIDRMVDQALVILCAESAGAMQAAFDMTVEWAFDRYSFGRPLASYQALKHRYADMMAWLEGSHAIIEAAADAVSEGRPDGSMLAAAAKAFVGHYGAELMQECVQLHGGIGVTFDHDLHIFLRRLSLNRMLLGTPAEHRLRLGDDALLGEEQR